MKEPSTKASRALHYEDPDEYRFYPPRVEWLRTVSEETGGKLNPDVEEIFADYGETVSRPVELWPLLAVLALIGYLLDIAIRRAPWIWERLESSASSSQCARRRLRLEHCCNLKTRRSLQDPTPRW